MAELDQASDVVALWDAEDRRAFMHWMCGYRPGAVLTFELRGRRQLPDAGVERAMGREPSAPRGES